MKKQATISFAEVENCRFDLIQHTIREMVGKEYYSPLVTFKQSSEGADIFFDMYRGNDLVALISVFRYNEQKAYLIDYREVNRMVENIKIN